MFLINGTPITDLRMIPEDCSLIIISDKRQFQGIYSESDAVDYNDKSWLKDLQGKASYFRMAKGWQ